VINRHSFRLFCIVTLLSLATACAHHDQENDTDIIAANHNAAQMLIEGSKSPLSKSQPILVTSFVDIDELQSSTMGRMAAEQVSSKFSQQGFSVVELKLRKELFIKENSGEFILSREIKNLSTEHDAQAVLAGTYAAGANSLFVTTKLIRISDGMILSSHDYMLPMGPDAQRLLK
jgi:TolB-like protein